MKPACRSGEQADRKMKSASEAALDVVIGRGLAG
jgi:hypothetical protein